MRRILITGAGSYIGTSFEHYLEKFDGYEIKTIDMTDSNWQNNSFSGYDTVFHVAGIAHSDTRKAGDDVKQKYYSVNTDLTVQTAKKAKAEGVHQFIFMSSMIVFGSKNERIEQNTVENPDNFYGESKLLADKGIRQLESDEFKVVSVRPPMIYGRASKGNYPLLAKFAKRAPFFPATENKRSMLYIENLCEFIRLMIENDESGTFYPQNSEYVNTSDMVKRIANLCGNNIRLTKIFNPALKIFHNNPIIRKVFGSMYYAKEMSNYNNFAYCVCDFEESIRRCEG